MPAGYVLRADGSVSGPDSDGETATGRVSFLIGGRHREDLVVTLADGRRQIFPVAFDVDSGRPFEPLKDLANAVSPPPDVVDFWTRIGRNADLACYGCHATGQTLAVAGSTEAGAPIPVSRWVEPGVGCEGCHGPGAPHIAAVRAGNAEAGVTGLRIGAGDVADRCAACHGLRDVLPSPFSARPAHHYGEPVYAAADPLLSQGSNFEFKDPLFPDLRPATFQQEAIALSQSGCALRGSLTCATCHDVHRGVLRPALQAADGGDGVCSPCHADVAAGARAHSRHAPGSPGGRCLDCHMAPIVRGPGSQRARDHSLAPPVAGAGEVPAACAVCHAGASNASQVAAAWAKWPKGPAARRREAIDAAITAAREDRPDAVARLGALVGDPGQGWFVRWAAAQWIALAARAPAAQPVTSSLISLLSDPNPALRRAAARALAGAGTPAALEALDRATRDSDPWAALEAAHALGALGAPTAGARMLQVLERPELMSDARAQYAFGHASVASQESLAAERALRRALEFNPVMVGALNDLGLALIAQGRDDEAVATWKRALEINPRYAPARQNLERATKR